MWKTFVLMTIVFTTVISGMLFWQWKAYSKQNDPINEVFEKAVQEITVKSKENKLHVTQRIHGLTKDMEYTVIKPDSLYGWSCKNIHNEPCDSKDENPETFLPIENELIFEYIIPIEAKEQAFLLNEWTTVIPNVKISSTSIIIVDSYRRGGTWVAGTKIKGFKEMDIIDYYYFEGVGAAPSLYWQLEPLLVGDELSKIHLYNSLKKPEININKIPDLTEFPYVSIVFTDLIAEQSGNGIIISNPNIAGDAFIRKLLTYYYEQKLNPSNKQKWITDVLTSISAQLQAETDKGKEVLEEMKKKLTEEELLSFIKLVSGSSEEITFQRLDQFVTKVKGLNTRFFTINAKNTQISVPLMFYDTRKVIVNGIHHKELEILYDEGKSLFPFIETMKALGYEASKLEDGEKILVTKGKNTYRFFLNRNIFIYNEDDYGLFEKPLTNINGQVYMNKQWLEKLFNITIDNDHKISISG
ncbi:stalk domain-containing protein [Cytobacillus depressus]|nr:stalk domain-containing protein [Cytobacillus depressus]